MEIAKIVSDYTIYPIPSCIRFSMRGGQTPLTMLVYCLLNAAQKHSIRPNI